LYTRCSHANNPICLNICSFLKVKIRLEKAHLSDAFAKDEAEMYRLIGSSEFLKVNTGVLTSGEWYLNLSDVVMEKVSVAQKKLDHIQCV
jgi:hypothetical protein